MDISAIVSPGAGWVSPLSEAPDPVFAEKMMGDGVLLDPTSGELCAPCDGDVVAIARTNHAVTVKTRNGAEILMHIGIDTVALKGEGFTVGVEVGQSVKTGQVLISYDLNDLAHQAKSVVTPIIISNSGAFEVVNRKNGNVAKGDVIFELRAIEGAGTIGAEVIDGDIVESTVVLPLEHGLHARPAARLATELKVFRSQIQIMHGAKSVDAKSTVGLMGLGTKLGDQVLVRAQGLDAQDAVDATIKHIVSGLGEAPVSVGEDSALAAPPAAQVKLDDSAVLKGTMGAPGLVVGTVVQWKKQTFDYVEKGQGETVELGNLLGAVDNVRGKLVRTVGGKSGAQQDVLQAHISLLDDPGLLEEARIFIGKGKSASYAWHKAIGRNIEILKSLNDNRMAERADDLLDIEAQVLREITGDKGEEPAHVGVDTIVIADELLPSQFVDLASKGLGGLCLMLGGPTSHVSILAADKGVPTLVALGHDISAIPNGTSVILEADRGRLHVAPSKKKIAEIKTAIKKRAKNQKLARKQAHVECRTKDSVRIEVFANLGADGEAGHAVEFGAEGCGLLRSEFLFLGRSRPPSEDEQLEKYQNIVDALDGRTIVIRTMDIGGDKPVPFVHIPAEDNPALGLRGIRISLRWEKLFLTQLRAILRVKSKGDVHIMLPMVVDVDEFRQAKALLRKACKQLSIIKPTSLGIMIETPASAILADQLAKEVDFFSVGTNDLSQYVLAIDRGNPGLAASIDALHPAVLRVIDMASRAAQKNDKWMGVCGGAASDLVAAPILIGLGVTELSSTIARLPELKAFIRTLDFDDCKAVASKALDMSSADEIRTFVRTTWPHLADWT